MKRNSKLSLALHALGHMAGEPDRYWTSAEIADHAGTNPVFVRRVLGKLGKSNLLNAKKGHFGGWQLAREPKSISLGDVYLALEESVIAGASEADAANCSLENVLHAQVQDVLTQIEVVLVERLHVTSIADIAIQNGRYTHASSRP